MLRVFSFIILFVSVSSRHVEFYRKDYRYIPAFDAFYKLHWDESGSSFNMAFQKCEDEGATLFYPNQQGEWEIVNNLTTYFSDTPNVTEAFVGLHDEFHIGEFITIDGSSTTSPLNDVLQYPDVKTILSCVSMDITNGMYRVGPCSRELDPILYVCKRSDDASCPTVDRGYQYNSVTKKCYKVNKRYKTWQEAMQTCYMEGGILAVIETETRHNNIFLDFIDNGSFYYVGIRKMFGTDDYFTVKGHKYHGNVITDSQYGYNREVDGLNCVTINRDNTELYVRAMPCNEKFQFVCEMELRP